MNGKSSVLAGSERRTVIGSSAHKPEYLAFKKREKSQYFQGMDSRSWDELRECLPDTGLNPEQRILQMERFERLHAAMAWLSPQEMQCLHLRAEGFRYREIYGGCSALSLIIQSTRFRAAVSSGGIANLR